VRINRYGRKNINPESMPPIQVGQILRLKDLLMQEHKAFINEFPPSEREMFWGCPLCGAGITNETGSKQIIVQRWSDASYEAVTSGELKLSGQGAIYMCNECLEAIKAALKD